MKRDSNTFFIVRNKDKKAVASFRGTQNLTVLDSEDIRLGLLDIVTTKNCEIEVDLRGIKLIDSSVFDTFNLLSRLAKRFNSFFYFTHVNKELMELIELVRSHAVFDIRILKEDNQPRNAA
jgi:anti-anti-sigma regulatory factor